MPLWNALADLWTKDSVHLVYHWLDPRARTDRPDDGQRLETGKHYFRLRLADVFLQRQVQWFTRIYPAVHSLVRFDFGSQNVEIPSVADASRVGLRQTDRGDVIARDVLLTPAMPFNGGTIDLDVGLVRVAGESYLQNFLQVLGGFSSLLAVPQLSMALSIAGPLSTGLQQLFSGSGDRHLGLRQSFAAQELHAGYVAMIRATEDQVDTNTLWVVKHQLRVGDGLEAGRHAPFEGFDYLLLRIELFTDREDWDHLDTIATPLEEAVSALGDGNQEKANFYIQCARVAVVQAPELTRADRRRVIERLNTRYRQAKEDLGASGLFGADGPSLSRAMKGAMSPELALQLGEPDLDEVFRPE